MSRLDPFSFMGRLIMYNLTKKPWFILIAIFCEGFVSISIEIITIRQLIPVAGTSVIVTSLIIGVFLLFLAFGYWRGGLHQQNFTDILQKNFLLGALFIGLGLSYPFIVYFFSLFSYSNHLLVTLTIYLLVIIAPIVFLIGQTVPLSMNLIDPKEKTAKIGGKVLFLSTLGSFLGAPFTSLVFMEFLGLAWCIVINCLILTTLALLFCKKRPDQMLYIILILTAGYVIFYLNVIFEHNHFVATTSYANYKIHDNETPAPNLDKGKILESNHSSASFINAKNKTFPYIELIKHILFTDLQLQHKNILVLGAGGFTLSAEKTNNNKFTYVDIDPKIKTIVEKHFLPKIKGDFIAQDARLFLTQHKKEYDVIVSDVYSNIMSIPPALLTKEYFQSIKTALKQDGFAIFNIIAHPFLNDNYSKRIDTTMRNVFGNCVTMPLKYTNRLSNIIYICKDSANAHDDTIYTDNSNNSTLDAINNLKNF